MLGWFQKRLPREHKVVDVAQRIDRNVLEHL